MKLSRISQGFFWLIHDLGGFFILNLVFKNFSFFILVLYEHLENVEGKLRNCTYLPFYSCRQYDFFPRHFHSGPYLKEGRGQMFTISGTGNFTVLYTIFAFLNFF
jgi:hypothetical protein